MRRRLSVPASRTELWEDAKCSSSKHFFAGREHVNPKIAVLVALSADESLRDGHQAAEGGAPDAFYSQNLAENELVCYFPDFACSIFRRRSRLHKVHIAELTLGEDLRPGERGAREGDMEVGSLECRKEDLQSEGEIRGEA